ncbi:MAG: iron-containing alcohol dehydrogenase [Vampirovibrionia bacterium]
MQKGFNYYMPTKLHFGAGSINSIGKIAKQYGTKAIIVTGKSSSKKIGALDKVINSLKEENIESVVFNKIEPNPRSTTMDEGGQLARKENCDIVIGLGGGSPMDASKVIAMLAKDNNKKAWDYVGAKEAPTEALPIICITTTSGTGSEADTFAVITNPETLEKPGIGFDCMFPKESIIDPELSTFVSPRVTASVGIDVFFHAIEAYTSKISSPISDMYAEKAIELVSQNLLTAYNEPDNITARGNMALANTLGGIAIQLAGTGLIHAMAHPISGHYDCAHGEALTSVSIGIIRHNYSSASEKYVKMANLMGGNISVNDPDAINKITKLLLDFYKPLGLNMDVTELGLKESDIETLADDTFTTMGFCVDINAAETNKEDVIRIYNESVKPKVH